MQLLIVAMAAESRLTNFFFDGCNHPLDESGRESQEEFAFEVDLARGYVSGVEREQRNFIVQGCCNR